MKNGSWILVANSERARCFALHAKNGTLHELADFLNTAVAEQRCPTPSMIASSTMLGELKPCLSSASSRLLQACVGSDLTRYLDADLQQRVKQALQLPD